jgi:nicotinamidase-related amidase
MPKSEPTEPSRRAAIPRLVALAAVARRLGIPTAMARSHWPSSRKLYRFGQGTGRFYVALDDAEAWIESVIVERPAASASDALPVLPAAAQRDRRRGAPPTAAPACILGRRPGGGRKSLYEKPRGADRRDA